MNRIGIILAGGYGTRLKPFTKFISKHLLPIHDKPMIYYPISILMLMNIREIIIIVTERDYNDYNTLLGNGKQFGIKIHYIFQNKPLGIPDAILKAQYLVNKKRFVVILGDNIFYGGDLKKNFIKISNKKNNTIIAYKVSEPQNYGVINFKDNKITTIEEKPKKPKSNYVATGIYFYENYVFDYIKKLKKSKRGELEISDLNNILLKKKDLECLKIGRGYAWLDTGTFEDMLETSKMISVIEKRQNLKIACLEEISFLNGWIDKKNIKNIIQNYKNTNYGKYLKELTK